MYEVGVVAPRILAEGPRIRFGNAADDRLNLVLGAQAGRDVDDGGDARFERVVGPIFGRTVRLDDPRDLVERVDLAQDRLELLSERIRGAQFGKGFALLFVPLDRVDLSLHRGIAAVAAHGADGDHERNPKRKAGSFHLDTSPVRVEASVQGPLTAPLDGRKCARKLSNAQVDSMPLTRRP